MTWLPVIPILLPLTAALLLYPILRLAGESRDKKAFYMANAACILSLIPLVFLFVRACGGQQEEVFLDGFCGGVFRLRCDGFRTLYAMIAGVMWTVTTIFSPGYFRHEPEHTDRYVFFILVTFSAAVGLMLSDSLFTAFVFFEVMSMASCPWVAHEESKGALRAAQTYLYVAVIGGLVMLMGILLLPGGMALLPFDELADAANGENLLLPAILILFGFGAKAGAFPLHIWLPKAHPVAPAPSSALLSGLLTKAGIFGILVLCCRLAKALPTFGLLVFILGGITMVLGAVLAIFSANLKKTLACSSLSQIGFILIGCGMLGMTGGEIGLAAFGTVQHMVNHSLFKLILFLCAGVAAMNAHTLKLEDLRGFGRKKPLLHFCFLMGALGISGIPGFSGYISKSMLHEGMLEMISEMSLAGENVLMLQVIEKLFIISGGMTLCYMLKLYICLFWQKGNWDHQTRYLSRPAGISLGLCACVVPLMGCLPGIIMSGIGSISLPFLNAEAPKLPIAYFSGENLLGAAKSIGIGLALYLLQFRFVMKKLPDGTYGYPDRWPKWLDMENSLYRPGLGALASIGYSAGILLDKLPDWIIAVLKEGLGIIGKALDLVMDKLILLLKLAGGAFSLCADRMVDGIVMVLRRRVLPALKERQEAPVGDRFTYRAGQVMDKIALNKSEGKHFEAMLAAAKEESGKRSRQISRSVSFGLLLFCVGLIAALLVMLNHG